MKEDLFLMECNHFLPLQTENLWFVMLLGKSKGKIGKKRVKAKFVLNVFSLYTSLTNTQNTK